MKFFRRWQPPDDEDALTALAFGFLRHAPVDRALQPWLAHVLGRPVQLQPLAPDNFWPTYDSAFEGQTWTEPELVLDVDDGSPLVVVIEVKPGLGMHTFDQICREVVDVSRQEQPERVALVMIGADLGESPEVAAWRDELQVALGRFGLEAVKAELRYCSWADLGRRVDQCGNDLADWRRYADDVIAQLRFHGLLGYDGGPVFDDLDGLTVVNAVELFNRTIRAARQLLLATHSQPRFHAAGYVPFGRTFALVRDGTSSALAQHEDSFSTTVALSAYSKAGWPAGAGVFLGLDLVSESEPHLHAGAFFTERGQDLVWSYAWSDEATDLVHEELFRTDKAVLPWAAKGNQTEWVYAARPWRPGDADADIQWTLQMLEAGSRAWDRAAPAGGGS